jgi:phosphoglycolate phosphatase
MSIDFKSIKIVVFDFDGTLVDSNQIKYDAFFELFPKDERHRVIIKEVLDIFLEKTRYVILEKVLQGLGIIGENIKSEVDRLALQYNEIVVDAVKKCPAMRGALNVLESFVVKYKLYLSSTTPDEALKEIILYRRWEHYFHAVFGFPNIKTNTLKKVIIENKINSKELLVVGDGDSDRTSAENVNANFYQINEESKIMDLLV